MSKKIVGYRVDSGTYEGRPYSNVKLSYVEDYVKNGIGSLAMTVKISQKVFDTILENLNCHSPIDIVGLEIGDFYYDRYKNISGVFLA